MLDTLRKSFRTALIFAAIGASVAIAVPLIMGALTSMGVISAGALSTVAVANVVNTSLIFGLFGALDPVYRVACNAVLGKEPAEQTTAAPRVSNGQDMGIVCSANHATTIDQERIARESMQKFR